MYGYLLIFFFFITSCTSTESDTPKNQSVTFETIVTRENSIWGLDFLSETQIIFTERSGQMWIYDLPSKALSEVKGVPKVHAVGQGGLLDVRVHPKFSTNSLIYFTYSEPVGDKSTTAVMSAKLVNNELVDAKKLFSGVEPSDTDHHYGSRLEFDQLGHIFISMGDRGDRDKAQSLEYHNGKVMRLLEDGSIPNDNPFVKKAGARPEIWSYGHRNPQGLTRHPETGEIWEAEMGPRGGDEVNLIRPGVNYGWPVITYGREYHGPSIGETQKEGMEQPLVNWTPSISPSGIAFYTGDKFPEWKNNLFLATLSGMHLHRVVFEGNKAVSQEELLNDHDSRWRSLRTSPDGHLYLGTDDGKLGRIIKK